MSLDDAKQYLHQLVGQSLELVCISGGEPCLEFDLVVNVVRAARAIGVLSSILAEYDPWQHPIIRELVRGGPALLAEIAQYIGYTARASYVSECHLCYDVRRFLRSRYSSGLVPLTCYEEAAA